MRSTNWNSACAKLKTAGMKEPPLLRLGTQEYRTFFYTRQLGNHRSSNLRSNVRQPIDVFFSADHQYSPQWSYNTWIASPQHILVLFLVRLDGSERASPQGVQEGLIADRVYECRTPIEQQERRKKCDTESRTHNTCLEYNVSERMSTAWLS